MIRAPSGEKERCDPASAPITSGAAPPDAFTRSTFGDDGLLKYT
jgi:hypothetical protein